MLSSKLKKNEELEKLLILYKNCKDDRKKYLIHLSIVESAMQYVKKIASSIYSYVSVEDLIQIGSIGLIKAIEAFDPKKNVKFKTYAGHIIRGEIKHYLRDNAPIIKAPRKYREDVSKIVKELEKLKAQGIENPSEELVSELTGVELRKIHSILNYENKITSIDNYADEINEEISNSDYLEFLANNDNKVLLKIAVEQLPKDLKKVIDLCYYNDYRQKEIAEKMQISQTQVSRLLKKAINQLYTIIEQKEKK